MINLKVGKTRCTIPNEWKELNVSQYAKVCQILIDYEIVDIEEVPEEHQEIQKVKNIKANREVFTYLSGLERSVVDQCNLKDMENCLNLMNQFLNKKVEQEIKEDSVADSFNWKGKTYFFPLPLMTETTFGDYIESEQVMMNAKEIEGGRFGLIAKQMAILCKEEGEETNDELIEKKTRLFEKLPMDIVWKFVFFLMKQTSLLQKSMKTFSKTDIDQQTDMQMKIGKS
tara:strand:- start:42 stop:725 length:684 start_codon:yes stop_codon:yes gene_type:complete